MKSNSKGLLILAALAIVIGLNGSPCSAQVAVTVTPSATSNTYSGFITLNITGLTTGQQVKVQTYLDLNGNGVVDANDPLVDVFSIADGGVTLIGGVTNISAPYDTNPAAGTITTALSFAPSLESMVGQKIYRVISNPPGAFTPVTAVLTVTNAATGQSVSGMVYSNGVTPLPNAVVVALSAANQNYFSGTIADNSGHYFLTLAPGSYVLLATMPGFYADQGFAAEVTLTNGMSATNDLVLTNGTVAISGSVFDAVSSNALGGVFLQAQCQISQHHQLFEIGFTDTNGNYTFGVTSNNWKIKAEDDRLAHRGYLTPQNNVLTVDASSGSVTNAGFGLYRGNALFYGQVTISNVPVANCPMNANDDEQQLSSKSFTDLNGNYAIVALFNTNVLDTNATWSCSPNTSNDTGARIATLANFIFSEVDQITFTNGQAYLKNFIGLPITATISGQLTDNLGNPISSVGVGASSTIAGNNFVTSFIDTDNNGDYSFGAANGQWFVNANCCGGDGLENNGLYDPANFHIVNIPPTNAVVNIVVYPANTPLLAQPGKVSPSQFNLNLYGASGFNYTVQASTNLAATNWTTLTIVSNLPGNPYLIQDFQATNSARFYRAFQGP